jgi:hypothetical protein
VVWHAPVLGLVRASVEWYSHAMRRGFQYLPHDTDVCFFVPCFVHLVWTQENHRRSKPGAARGGGRWDEHWTSEDRTRSDAAELPRTYGMCAVGCITSYNVYKGNKL